MRTMTRYERVHMNNSIFLYTNLTPCTLRTVLIKSITFSYGFRIRPRSTNVHLRHKSRTTCTDVKNPTSRNRNFTHIPPWKTHTETIHGSVEKESTNRGGPQWVEVAIGNNRFDNSQLRNITRFRQTRRRRRKKEMQLPKWDRHRRVDVDNRCLSVFVRRCVV